MSESPPIQSTGTPAAPVDLFCPQCSYNVTYTGEDRCPECGEAFDRAYLTHWATAPDQPLPSFPDMGLAATSSLANWALSFPSLLGRWLPPRPDHTGVGRFSLFCRLTASIGIPSALVLFNVVFFGGTREALILLTLAPSILIGSISCEEMVVAVLSWLVSPRSVAGSDVRRFWRCLVRCFTVYLLIHLGVVLLILFLAAQALGFMILMPFISAAVIAWWWYALTKAIWARSEPSPSQRAAVILIALVGLLSIVLGVAIWMMATLVLTSMRGF